jgi:hypothetical protein
MREIALKWNKWWFSVKKGAFFVFLRKRWAIRKDCDVFTAEIAAATRKLRQKGNGALARKFVKHSKNPPRKIPIPYFAFERENTARPTPRESIREIRLGHQPK